MKLKKFTDYIIITAGAMLCAMSVLVFTSPNNIAPGGLTGVGIILNYLFSVPIGTFIFAMNVPLFFLGFRHLGRKFVLKSLIATAIVSLSVDLLAPFVPEYRGDMMLACIFGGFFNGTGIALIFSRGGSSGGTDIIASLIHKLFPYISVGRVILVSDALIVSLSAVVFGSVESALYAAISIFVSSKLIDVIIYGTSRNNGKLMIIITDNYKPILRDLLNDVSRGVTVLDSVGGYSGEGKKLLLCALRPNQVYRANYAVKAHDKNAFIIITTAGTINGLGFLNET